MLPVVGDARCNNIIRVFVEMFLSLNLSSFETIDYICSSVEWWGGRGCLLPFNCAVNWCTDWFADRRSEQNQYMVPCPLCSKVFRYRHNMVNHCKHKHVSGSEKAIPCPMCDMTFTWPSKLSSHLDDVHNIAKEFECGSCGRFFHHYSRADRHIQMVHKSDNVVIKQHPQHRKQN